MKGGGGQIDSPSPEKTTFKMPNLIIIMVEIYIIYIQLSTGAMTDREINVGKIYKKLNILRVKSFLSEIKAFFMIF